jgi:hypothetical protein
MTDTAAVHQHYDGEREMTDAAATTRMTDAAIVNIEYPTTRDDMKIFCVTEALVGFPSYLPYSSLR